MAANAGERSDQRASEARLEFEHLAVVDDPGDHAVHVVGALAPRGHEVGQRRIGIGVVVAVEHGRQFPAVGGQIGKEVLDLHDGVVLRLGDLVDLAGEVEVDVSAAELLQGDQFAGGDLDHAGR